MHPGHTRRVNVAYAAPTLLRGGALFMAQSFFLFLVFCLVSLTQLHTLTNKPYTEDSKYNNFTLFTPGK